MSKVDGWSQGRYNAFITSTLRSGMRRWPPKWQTLKNAYVDTRIGKSGRKGKHYQCAMCKLAFPSTMVEVDHINPVVDPDIGFVSWDAYIDRLFCSVENLQVLCKPCHKQKTKEEKCTKKPLKKTLKKPRSSTASPASTATRKVASGGRQSRKPSTRKPRASSSTS